MRKLLTSLKKTLKIKTINIKQRPKQTWIVMLLLIALIGGSFLWAKPIFPKLSLSETLIIEDIRDNVESLSAEEYLKNLPISEIDTYDAKNGWGTAVLIPQYHRYPGSNPEDPINDSAERTQEQIYQILPHVSKMYDTKLVMVEGEIYGEVSDGKVSENAKKIKERNTLSSRCQKLEDILSKNGLEPAEENLIKEMDKAIAEIDRSIILNGAPFKLKAEGKKLALFGSENKTTQEESRTLVKKYIYLQDREKEMNSQSRRLSSRNSRSDKLFSDDMKLLLSKLLNSRGNSLSKELKRFESDAKAKNDQESLRLIKEIEKSFDEIKNNSRNASASIASTSGSRSDNPYANIRDPEKIEDMLKETEEQINEVVIDKRNKETAENFSNMLKEENQTAGIIQFGAGHEQGLIEELNDRGISVVVITPEEVDKRNN